MNFPTIDLTRIGLWLQKRNDWPRCVLKVFSNPHFGNTLKYQFFSFVCLMLNINVSRCKNEFSPFSDLFSYLPLRMNTISSSLVFIACICFTLFNVNDESEG